MKNCRLQGFTLIELSIVLLIIGALIGSLLYGTSLLNTSRLQTIMTDADSYTTAVANFKQTYQSLPGDFTNAQSVWGADSNCTTTSGGLTGLGVGGGTSGTCNGNGDGMIANTTGYSAESFLFWQHLSLAGMLAKPSADCAASATGTASCGSISSIATIGFNVPAGSVRGSGFSVIWEGSAPSGDANFFPSSTTSTTMVAPGVTTSYGNVLLFGAVGGTTSGGTTDNNLTRDAILSPDQAAQIDTKMDDGLPGSGKVRAFIYGASYTPSCTTTASASTSQYNTSVTNPLCSLIFVMGF